jgi:predicted RNase H-like HicB family nuclease
MWYDMYMKKIIQFNVEKGEKYYVAHSADIPVVTQALTLDELTTNIKEATELYFEA